MVIHAPSKLAAVSLYIAFKSVKTLSPWNAVMTKNTGYTEKELKEFSVEIVRTF
jgi:hypothetical protein